MKRMTGKRADGRIFLEPEALESGAAALRLKRFEDFFEHLQRRKQQIPGELEELRAQNKGKTYHFRELMTEEMTTKMVLDMLKLFDLEEERES